MTFEAQRRRHATSSTQVDSPTATTAPPEASANVGGLNHDYAQIAVYPEGQALSSEVSERAALSFGLDSDRVRVHESPDAGTRAAALGFRAFAQGNDVHFPSGGYTPDSGDGRFVLFHELAHVAQSQQHSSSGAAQSAARSAAPVMGFGGTDHAAEEDANRAASAAIRGQRYRVTPFAPLLRGFGATAPVDKASGQPDATAIVHENQTKVEATQVGFNDRDAAMIYSGNWQRDMNQLLLPKVQQANPVLYELLSIAHTAHFGFPIPSATEFGTYDPVEHIDNPGGQRGNETFNQSGDNDSASSSVGDTTTPRATKPGPLGLVMQDPPKDSSGQPVPAPGLASADPRYAATAAAMAPSSVENPSDAAAFHVDQSGIPAYLQTSRNQLKLRLRQGLETLTNAGGDAARRDRGLRYAGEALHVMQDYYAHSNFVEIAMNMLLESGVTPAALPATATGGGGAPSAGGTNPLDLVQVLNLAQIDPRLKANGERHELNTYVHGTNAGGVDPGRANLRTNGGRQIMATGTFTLEDTAESLKEKFSGALEGMNPFEKGATGPSKGALAVMTWLEANPPYVGDVSGRVRQLGGLLDGAKPAVHAVLRGIGIGEGVMGRVEAGLERGVGAVREGFHAASGGIARLLGSDGAAQDQAGQAAQTATDHRVDAANAEGVRQRQTAERFLQRYDALTAQLQAGTGLRDLYLYAYDASQTVTLENLAKEIPVVGDQIAALVKVAVDRVKEAAREALEGAWHRASRQAVAELDAAVSAAIGSTEVRGPAQDDTIPQTMTQPTHTDIAKDFDAHQHGAEDTASVIEEGREWLRRLSGVGAAVDSAERALTDIAHDPQSAPQRIGQFFNEASETMKVAAPGPHEDEGHRHEHRHGGAWLAGLADDLAHRASNAILVAYHAASELPSPNSGLGAVQAAVDQWFAHPADTRGLWEGTFMQRLTAQTADSAELRRELARRVATPPLEQAPNVEETHAGENRDHPH